MIRRPPRSTLFPHDALPISASAPNIGPKNTPSRSPNSAELCSEFAPGTSLTPSSFVFERSEEHTSELQSRRDLVCRLLLEKKKRKHSPFDPRAQHPDSARHT